MIAKQYRYSLEIAISVCSDQRHGSQATGLKHLRPCLFSNDKCTVQDSRRGIYLWRQLRN